MFGRVLIGKDNVTRCIIDTKTPVIEVIVAIGERQRMLFINLPLQSQLRTQLADILTVF